MTRGQPMDLTTYGPEKLFPLMRDNVFFGARIWEMGIPSRHAVRLMSDWATYLLEHKHGVLLKVNYANQFRSILRFTRSKHFDTIARLAGYGPEVMDIQCAAEEHKRQFLFDIEPFLETLE